MSRYTIRTLRPDDFDRLLELEHGIFGASGEKVLCPHYLRLCTDFFGDTCFLALDGDASVGYLLCFVRDREAHCTTLAIRPEYQRKRVTMQLLQAFVSSIVGEVDRCWFTVSATNVAARSLHKWLGATELGVRAEYYGAGEDRIISMIDRARFEEMRPKYERLGLVEPVAEPAADAA